MPVMQRSFQATRAAGLAHLADVTTRLGRDYAAGRNTDRGPDAPSTSMLSPWLRRRMVLEREVVTAALAEHGAQAADKYVQEVFWRSYFKGHLETRPWLWTDYLRLAAQGQGQLANGSALRRRYEDAVAGNTGIDGFDDWVRELVEGNWLHNHTRMWFASIWIFTLQLPWALGAEFFMRHLVDGDPASNTLSWRWVAGLHTAGKPYVARAENIRRYTDGRHDPAGLNEEPTSLREADSGPAVALPPPDPLPSGEVALLLHLDDLHPESLVLGDARVVRVGGMLAHPDGAAERVVRFNEAAMTDALARAGAHFGCPAEAVPAEAVGEGWAGGLPVVTPWAPVGPSAAMLPAGCARIRRDWDSNAWPLATRGYFKLRTVIPELLGKAG